METMLCLSRVSRLVRFLALLILFSFLVGCGSSAGGGNNNPPATKSSNAKLSSLSVSTGTIAFVSSTLDYDVEVANNVSSLTVTAVTEDAKATLKVNDVAVASSEPSSDISLNFGDNTITIVVTAEDGVTTDTYTITVKRLNEPSHNANLANLTLSTSALSPAFDVNTVSYTSIVALNVSSVTVTPTGAGVNSTIQVNGVNVSSGTASASITLNAGINSITVKVTAEDGITSKQYNLSVYADSLIGYWPFDGDGIDLSLSNVTLELTSGTLYSSSGLFDQTLSLDGDLNHYASDPISDPRYNFGNSDFTIQAWVNFHTKQINEVIVEKWNNYPETQNWGWTLCFSSNTTCQFHTGLFYMDSYPIPFSTGVWHQFIIRRKGNTFSMFYDNTIVATASYDGALTDTDYPLLIGRRSDSRGLAIDGKIDEVAIWNKALSDSDISNLWNNGIGSTIKITGGVDNNEIISRSLRDGASGINFIDLNSTISSDGWITSFSIWPESNAATWGTNTDSKQLSLIIYRNNGDYFDVVGKSPIETVATTQWDQKLVFHLPGNGIQVKKGDIIGWYYPPQGITPGDPGGVIAADNIAIGSGGHDVRWLSPWGYQTEASGSILKTDFSGQDGRIYSINVSGVSFR
jgi:hypothetical protein